MLLNQYNHDHKSIAMKNDHYIAMSHYDVFALPLSTYFTLSDINNNFSSKTLQDDHLKQLFILKHKVKTISRENVTVLQLNYQNFTKTSLYNGERRIRLQISRC